MSSSLWGPPKAPQGTSKGERARVWVYGFTGKGYTGLPRARVAWGIACHACTDTQVLLEYTKHGIIRYLSGRYRGPVIPLGRGVEGGSIYATNMPYRYVILPVGLRGPFACRAGQSEDPRHGEAMSES